METEKRQAVPPEKASQDIDHNAHDSSDLDHGHLVELEVDLARVIAEDDVEGDCDADTSPFAAVRAVVPETDDPDMPVNTFRAWFLGIVRFPALRPHGVPGILSY